MSGLPTARRRRLIVIGLLRASATTVALVAAYYLLPLDHLNGVPLSVSLDRRASRVDRHDGLPANSGQQSSVPGDSGHRSARHDCALFLLLFAANYFLMAQADLGNFNVDSLTRTDALYFTVIVFATVGFGDITATSQAARAVVTAQMILDLFVLGLLVRVFLGAVQRGRQQHTAQQETESS
jgi:hypothetical protein